MVQIEDNGFDELAREVVAHIDETYEDKHITFKVDARRARKNYPLNSMEINMQLGEKILDAFEDKGMKVDVHKPDIFVNVEIRSKINIYSQEIKGIGGMPVGTNGKAVLLLSGGIDSPVAGYMVAKRGVTLETVYFNTPPYTSERAKQKVIDLAGLVSKYAGTIKLHIVNFTDIQMYIYEKCPHDQLTIIMKRYFYRIAQEIANSSGAMAIATGESIGQVSSQTLQSLAVINEVAQMPVIRPLVSFDKQEIIDISEKIGTYETSIQPYEDCCTTFVAKHPVTKPNSKSIHKSEEHLAEKIDELVRTALETVEVITIG
jgi:thiamine biosynthesis protein ThiI